MDLRPGLVIAGRYRVDSKVGAGGMGEVWVGDHVAVGSRVALKTLLPAAACDHEVVARFKREAHFLGRIRSDYVARVVDFVADDVVGLVLVMEYIEGEPLSKILQTRSLSVEEGIDVGVDIVTALCDLHRSKVIHRDMKPGNIIMQPLRDGTHRAVIVDFGVSRALSEGAEDEEMTGITRADMAVGTMEYMAPEQILNSRDAKAGSDLYAVGAMLFRAVTGRHIFGDIYDAELAKTKLTQEAPPLVTGRPDQIARALEQIVNKAIQRRPKNRYDRAEAMLVDLKGAQELARYAALELEMETTHDTRSSVPIFIEPLSSDTGITPAMRAIPALPSIPGASAAAHGGPTMRAAMTIPMPQEDPDLAATVAIASSARPPAASGVAVRQSMTTEGSVTLPSQSPLQGAPGTRGSEPEVRLSLPRPTMASGADVMPAPEPPRRRGIPAGLTVGLVLAALAGGVGLGSTWTQRKIAETLGRTPQAAPAATPEAVANVAPPAAEPAPAAAEPAAEEPAAAPAESVAAATAPGPAATQPAIPRPAANPGTTALAARSPTSAPLGEKPAATAPRPAGTTTAGAATAGTATAGAATAGTAPSVTSTATATQAPTSTAPGPTATAPRATTAPTEGKPPESAYP